MRHDLTTLNLVLAIEQTRSITRGAAQERVGRQGCRRFQPGGGCTCSGSAGRLGSGSCGVRECLA